MDRNKALFLAVFLFSAVSIGYCGEGPTEREWKLYYDYTDRVMAGSQNDTNVNFEAVLKDNNATQEDFTAALNKVDAYGLRPEEKKIYKQAREGLKVLPANATFEQIKAVLKDIGRKNSLSLSRMDDILLRGSKSELGSGE